MHRVCVDGVPETSPTRVTDLVRRTSVGAPSKRKSLRKDRRRRSIVERRGRDGRTRRTSAMYCLRHPGTKYIKEERG